MCTTCVRKKLLLQKQYTNHETERDFLYSRI